MLLPMHSFRFLAIAALTLGLAGCALTSKTSPSLPSSVAEAAFSESDTFSRTYGSSPERSCEAARRALLSQAYLMTEVAPTRLSARKNFQQNRDQHYEVEFHITCVANPGQSSTIFVSAVQQLYGLRKTNSSASVGVGILGSFSVPVMSEDESLIKIGSVTLTKPDLYKRFFDLVENHLVAMSSMPEEATASVVSSQATPAILPEAPTTASAPAPAVPTLATEDSLNPGAPDLTDTVPIPQKALQQEVPESLPSTPMAN
ncbi:DUF2242 domain-containing protein [Lampropedia puyangensis]|uniref:DUF2242 domain-containing protein n=1 Tax=Lampropedia puyangensis TaxID=1330072 RepID=A0A4S8EX82_9BURK|nr:DUF2242 domain-containing protein [Lampropedia puyangensis]THT98464.1 DUF2242 domain-containing protein [Lampropedia puyangensis]